MSNMMVLSEIKLCWVFVYSIVCSIEFMALPSMVFL
jgi:hypothetical protein